MWDYWAEMYPGENCMFSNSDIIKLYSDCGFQKKLQSNFVEMINKFVDRYILGKLYRIRRKFLII